MNSLASLAQNWAASISGSNENVRPSAQHDQRAHPRVRAIGRTGRVDTIGDRGLCRIQNLSHGGMMIETSMEMQRGDSVRISLDGKKFLAGRVAWRQGYRIGIQLTRPVDCFRLIRELAQGHSNGLARQPRLPVASPAHAKCELGSFRTDVVDISRKGIKIRHARGLPTGLPIEIALRCGIDAKGIVRWSHEGFVGIEFSGMIAVEHLASSTCL